MKGMVIFTFGLLAALFVLVMMKTTAVVDASSLRKASLMDQYDDAQSPSRRRLQKFHDIGKDPTGPLGLCEGDCDNDNDCSSGLICFQRSAGQSIPGCSGVPKSNSDFCIQKPSSNGDDDDNNDDDNDDDNGGGGGESFALKLYWEQGKSF